MRGFIKSIILIAIFFALIMFSFFWFNQEKGNIKDIPYVEEVFERISVFSVFMGEVSIKEFDFKKIFKKTKENATELFPLEIKEGE